MLASSLPGQVPPGQQAVELLKKGHVEQANQLLLDAVRHDPNDQAIQGLLGQIAFSQKDYANAALRFGKAPDFLARSPLFFVNYAEALLETGSHAAAKQALDQVPRADAIAQFETGLLLARFGEFLAAERHFLLAKRDYPQPLALNYNLALAQYRARKFADSAASLEEVRKLKPDDPDVLSLLGQAYLDGGQAEKALEVIRQAIAAHPSDERNYVELGKLAVDEDMAPAGLKALDEGVERMPNSYALRLQRAYLGLSLSMYTQAEADYRAALQLNSGSTSAKIGLAFVYLQSQREQEAAELLEQIASTDATFFVYYLLGEHRLREGANDLALENFKKSAALEPQFGPTHTNLGKIYLKKNDAPAAVGELERAVQIDPDDITALYQLSIAYRRNGEREKAQQALAKVKGLNQQQRELGLTKFLTRKLRKLRSSEDSPF